MNEILDKFPVVIELPVAWGEMDAFGHLNNTIYFRYFESARMAYMDRLRAIEYMEETGVGPILASTCCRFRLPLTYPDTVSVGTRISEIDTDRVTMEYAIVSHTHQKLAAEGTGVIVTFDYRSRTKTRLPLEMKERIDAIEKTVIET